MNSIKRKIAKLDSNIKQAKSYGFSIQKLLDARSFYISKLKEQGQ